MKNTKIMLVAVSVYIVTYCLVSLIISYFAQWSFHRSITSIESFGVMLSIGWLPALIVGHDYSEKLD
jgi:hypothetical protein